MKPLIVFHAHCTDGFGAAFAAWMKFGDEAEYIPASYGKFEWPDVVGRDVYILDFSFSKPETLDLMETAERVIWIDHHKTAFENWIGGLFEGHEVHHEKNDLYEILLDFNKSGAMLAWEYFHPGTEIPMMIKHIDDRDRWQFKIEGSKEFHAALASYKPWSFEQWTELNTQMQNWDDSVSPHFIFKEGRAILAAHEQNVKSVVAGSKRDVRVLSTSPKPGGEHWECIVDVNGLAANCPPHLASDVGHDLANESGTFGLCWYMGRDGKAKVSLRSNGDYDVSAIAKSFGGGGHRNASGMEVPIDVLLGWMK